MPLVRRTRAILRKAEFGFLGVIVRTTVHTPRFWGAPFSWRIRRCLFVFRVYNKAGALLFTLLVCRPLRINWLIVGTFFCLRKILLWSNLLQNNFIFQ